MFYDLKRRGCRWKFEWSIRGILDTPPLRLIQAPWTIVSMVGETDVPMYILAIKSFYSNLGSGNVIAIISKKMKEKEIDKLKHHIVGIEFQIIEEIDVHAFQHGGCWERLVYILDRARHEFVIQLDSDTITIGGDIDEIKERINANASFAYVDRNRPIMSLSAASAEAKLSKSNYVGLVLERSFENWPNADRLRYCRGSAAIAGFARTAEGTTVLEEFYSNMKASLGPRHQQWGTEQCASNFVIANASTVSMLPFPEYSTYPGLGTDQAVKMFHMLGSVRYADGYYAKKGKKIIAKMKEQLNCM
ncbi:MULTISPECIES: hypothetical protein [Acidiphilium]|nr:MULTISPECIES: hypothetical protein [Acidiphilium]